MARARPPARRKSTFLLLRALAFACHFPQNPIAAFSIAAFASCRCLFDVRLAVSLPDSASRPIIIVVMLINLYEGRAGLRAGCRATVHVGSSPRLSHDGEDAVRRTHTGFRLRVGAPFAPPDDSRRWEGREQEKMSERATSEHDFCSGGGGWDQT